MNQRDEVVSVMRSWIGLKESDGSYKKILDIWNSQKYPPRGVKMKTGMSWCACTWSAIAIKLGYTDIMPIEVSCGQLIERAKKMGVWKEKDSYIPTYGDAVLYDWDDSGKDDCTGWPDHIGVVETVNRGTNKMTIIEGNYKDSVKRRQIQINGRYIRGFIAPKYKEIDEEKPVKKKKSVTKPLVDPKKKYNETVMASRKPDVTEKSIKGEFKVTATSLRIRDGAGTQFKTLCIIPKYTVVNCVGKKTGNWYFVEVPMDGVLYKGLAYCGYLKRV